MSEIKNYTKKEVIDLINHNKEIFEVARLVNVGMTHQLDVNEANDDFEEKDYNCYAVWNKEHRCEHCVSAMAFKNKNKQTKFEFIENDIYYVVAKYIIMEGTPFMLELVTKIDDSTLFGAYGKDKFVETITNYNEKLYVDPLTHAYNRNYYDSQLIGLSRVKAVAMLDIDHFKEINDTYGHDAGDIVLKTIIEMILSKVRKSDSVVRYGGDEFIIMFEEMNEEAFESKLNSIREAVSQIIFPGYPDIKTSISIGGVLCDLCDKGVMLTADERLYKAKQTRNTVVIKDD